MVGRRTHVAKGRKPDGCVVGGDHDVTVEGQVRPACQAVPVNLGDGGLVHFPKGSHAALKSLEHPGVVVDPPARSPLDAVVGTRKVAGGEVVAG